MDMSDVTKAQLSLSKKLGEFIAQNQGHNSWENNDVFQVWLRTLNTHEFICLKGGIDSEVERRLS